MLLHPGMVDDVDQGGGERLLDHVPLLYDRPALHKQGKDK